MQISLIYLLALAAAFGAVVLWKICRLVDTPTRKTLFSFLRKKLLYTLILKRQKSSSEINVLAFLGIVLFAAANIVACTLQITTSSQLAQRCGTLFIVNVIPLYLGGRTSLIVDRFLRVPLRHYSLLHRWLGRICVLQGLIHGIIHASTASLSVPDTMLLSLLAALGLLSVIYIRRYMYEIFLKTHLIFSVALAITLWFHIRLPRSRAAICLGTASCLWLLQHISWLTRLVYRNFGSGTPERLSLKSFTYSEQSAQVLEATIVLNRPWKVQPGQYVYLTLPSEAKHRVGFIQSHPYIIAWADEAASPAEARISLLIQRANGFSDSIFHARASRSSVIIDGPYGHSPPLDDYDKVMFIASGIGIAAHILSIKHLLEAHDNRTARIRRLTLVWFVETLDQEQWASSYFDRLRKLDKGGIFLLYIHLPADKSLQATRLGQLTNHLLKTTRPLFLGSYINSEASAEAGNTAVIVCGTPHFEDTVGRGVRHCATDIHFFTAGFQPDETSAGHNARKRYATMTEAGEDTIVPVELKAHHERTYFSSSTTSKYRRHQQAEVSV